MALNLSGLPIGSIVKTEKGYIQEIGLLDKDNRLKSSHKVFSKDASKFNLDDKGHISVSVDLPDFLFAVK